jgi:NADPH:quinone reductase-like Zn-dependent oxidoreductase
MQQVWISRAGKPKVLVLRRADDPIPRSGEVKIRVEACGVNFADIMGRMGIYPDAPKIPFVPGFEVAGVIDAVGQGVAELKEGDKVLAVTRFGGYSDLVCVPHYQVMQRWDWMSAAEAAALPVNYLTAYVSLLVMGSLKPDDKVLIHNAAGGVGLAALDICKIVGAETFGTASPQKHDFLKGRGLDHTIDYRNRQYEGVIRELTGGKGLQLILDPLGGAHWARNYRLLAPTGRLICSGVSSAVAGQRRSWLGIARLIAQVPFYTPTKLMNDNRGVAGINLSHMWEQTDLLRRWLQQIMHWYDEALFRPHIDKSFPLAQAAEAHQTMHNRENIGKLLLIP